MSTNTSKCILTVLQFILVFLRIGASRTQLVDHAFFYVGNDNVGEVLLFLFLVGQSLNEGMAFELGVEKLLCA